MTTGYFCPVEGCERHRQRSDDPPFDSKESVQGHINAMSDDAHREARKKGETTPLEAGDGDGNDDPPADPPGEGGEGPSEGAEGGGSETTATDDPQKGGTEGETEAPEGGLETEDTDDMSDDVSDQWGTGSGQGVEGRDGKGNGDPSDPPRKGSSKGGIPWVAVATAGAAVGLAAIFLGGEPDQGTDSVEVDNPTEQSPDPSGPISRDGGGLQ
ncbi:hypothetical protein [Halostella salina]|uniref:hypothetical protein n=1 Tax=Halostella salina TaxID=1547897 RepID=UPI000EF7C606|nr:hypothetical protein [Halostella salina]